MLTKLFKPVVDTDPLTAEAWKA